MCVFFPALIRGSAPPFSICGTPVAMVITFWLGCHSPSLSILNDCSSSYESSQPPSMSSCLLLLSLCVTQGLVRRMDFLKSHHKIIKMESSFVSPSTRTKINLQPTAAVLVMFYSYERIKMIQSKMFHLTLLFHPMLIVFKQALHFIFSWQTNSRSWGASFDSIPGK